MAQRLLALGISELAVNFGDAFSDKLHIQIDKILIATSNGQSTSIDKLVPGDIAIVQDFVCHDIRVLIIGTYQSDFQYINCISDEGRYGDLSWIQKADRTDIADYRITFFDQNSIFEETW